MSPRPGRCSARAFTLAELLVVIAIVAVLVALLLPVLGRAREQARRVACAANLRSLGQALTMYTQAYARYPGCSGEVPGEPTNNGVAVWPPRLRVFTGDDQRVFHCPSQDERCEWRKDAPPNAPRADARHEVFGYRAGEPLLFSRAGTHFGYGYNHLGVGGAPGGTGLGWLISYQPGGGREVHASRVKVPSGMIAIVDTKADGYDDFMVRAFSNDVAEPGKVHPASVHSGGSNVLFCDGHVQWYLQQEITVSMQPGHYLRVAPMWNVTNLPY